MSDVKIVVELTLDEAKTVARALDVAKGSQGDVSFYRECTRLHSLLIQGIQRAVEAVVGKVTR